MRKNKSFYYLISLCIGIFAVPQAYAGYNINLGVKSNLISHKYEQKIPYELLTGPVIYKEASGENESSGYAVISSTQLDGSLNEYVYDFSADYSSRYIFEKTIEYLEKNGYEKLFYCMQDRCGEKDGWRVYIDKDLNGEEGTQHYVAAHKLNADGSSTYKAIYIIDIDSEPRLSLSTVNVPLMIYSAEKIDSLIKENGKVNFPALTFSSNSTQITASGLYQLQEIASYITRYSDSTQYNIVGHADSVGSVAYNKKLSEKRAGVVFNELIKQYNIDSSKLEAIGVGLSQPLEVSETSHSLNNRRVELVKKETVLLGVKE